MSFGFLCFPIRLKMNEDKIIENFKLGDESTFPELLNRYQDRIYNLCRYMLENPQDAEDAAQDTFVKAFQGLKSFTPSSSLYTWLYRIAVNTCLDHKRKFSLHSLFFPKDTEDHIDSFPSPAPSPEAAYAAKQSMQALQVALNRLSTKLRVVILLNELEGLSYEQIAEVLDVSVGTVKSRISRAREELRKNMGRFTEQK
jgi:RNA polymerase sigma-70 factor (ECF subfamily)